MSPCDRSHCILPCLQIRIYVLSPFLFLLPAILLVAFFTLFLQLFFAFPPLLKHFPIVLYSSFIRLLSFALLFCFRFRHKFIIDCYHALISVVDLFQPLHHQQRKLVSSLLIIIDGNDHIEYKIDLSCSVNDTKNHADCTKDRVLLRSFPPLSVS